MLSREKIYVKNHYRYDAIFVFSVLAMSVGLLFDSPKEILEGYFNILSFLKVLSGFGHKKRAPGLSHSLSYVLKRNLAATEPVVDLVINKNIHGFVGILRHDAIDLITGQTVVNCKLGNRITNIVVQARNHLDLTLNAMGKIFHIDIGKGRHDFLLCFMEGIVELEISEEFIIGFTGIANLKHSSKV